MSDSVPSELPEQAWAIARITPTSEGVSIDVIRELDRTEHDRLAKILKGLAYSAPLDVFHTVSQNMGALDALQSMLARRVQNSGPRPKRSDHYVPTEHLGGRIVSVLSNYLSSGRMYVDSVSDILSAAYGKSSSVYLGFTSDTHSLFDDSAGYRFTYHLRNALQHVGSLPLRVVESVAESADARVRVVAERDELLGWYKWNRAVKEDLLNGPEIVEVLPLLRDGYEGYVWLERRRVQRCLEGQRDGVIELSSMAKESEEEESGLLLVEIRDLPEFVNGGEMKMDRRPLPNPRFLEAVVAGYESGDFEAILPHGYERPTSSSQAGAADNMHLVPALDLLDAQRLGGRQEARLKVARAVNAGPKASVELILGLLNLCTMTLSQVGLAIGQSVESQLCSWREEAGPSSETR